MCFNLILNLVVGRYLDENSEIQLARFLCNAHLVSMH